MQNQTELNLQHIDPNKFRIDPATENHRLSFGGLILEQAAKHNFHIAPGDVPDFVDRLYSVGIEKQGTKAFLVSHGQQVLGAVTYYPCLSAQGPGVHLEDIITTSAARKHGVGHFAMHNLAAETIKLNARYLEWDCLTCNTPGLKFYQGLGAQMDAEQHSLRIMGGLEAQANAHALLAVPMRPESVLEAAAIFRWSAWTNAGSASQMHGWLGEELRRENEDFIILADYARDGSLQGAAYAHRNFSTFRAQSGMHIRGLAVRNSNAATVRALFNGLAKEQTRRGWTGHTDISIRLRDAAAEVVQEYGFEPVRHGTAQTILHRLDYNQLSGLSMPGAWKVYKTEHLNLGSGAA